MAQANAYFNQFAMSPSVRPRFLVLLGGKGKMWNPYCFSTFQYFCYAPMMKTTAAAAPKSIQQHERWLLAYLLCVRIHTKHSQSPDNFVDHVPQQNLAMLHTRRARSTLLYTQYPYNIYFIHQTQNIISHHWQVCLIHSFATVCPQTKTIKNWSVMSESHSSFK